MVRSGKVTADRACGRLVALQMISTPNIDENLATVERLLEQVSPGDLVLLPENFSLFADASVSRKAAEPLGAGPVQDFLSEMAQRHSCYLVAGSVPVREQELCFASSLAYAPDGSLIARYNKLHLFDVDVNDGVGRYRESDLYTHGDLPVLFDTPMGRVGMAICYDLRFPELFAWLRAHGADILLLPAAFTYVTGKAHWQTLLQSRAIETQCYLVAANQGGVHPNGRHTWGHSMIIDPWGEIMAEHAEGSGVVMAKRDPLRQMQIRAEMPLAQHRRFSVVFDMNKKG